MHPVRNTLPEAIRQKSVALLNKHLAAAISVEVESWVNEGGAGGEPAEHREG